MAVDAVFRVLDPASPKLLDLRDIRIVTKLGGTIDDSELVEGLVFAQKATNSGSGGITRVEKAKIGLIQVRAAVPFPALCLSFRASLYTGQHQRRPSHRTWRCTSTVIGLLSAGSASAAGLIARYTAASPASSSLVR